MEDNKGELFFILNGMVSKLSDKHVRCSGYTRKNDSIRKLLRT